MPLTCIEINSRNLQHNLRQFKNIAPQSELWPVVKSNAYGHGLLEVLSLLNDNSDVAGLACVNLDEALQIAKSSQHKIMVLSYFDFDELKIKQAIEQKIILPVYSSESFRYLQSLAAELHTQIEVMVKIDSGTNRLGFKAEDEKLVAEIMSAENFLVHSLYTHFAESEIANLDFSQEQLKYLKNYQAKYPRVKFHSACSAAAIAIPEARLDIVRLGLALYGLWPSTATQERGQKQAMDLRPVLSLKTKIIQIKKIQAQESVGYNRTFVADEDCSIAILPMGYYEGWPRILSNKGSVLINGQSCQIVGNICMNLTMVRLAEGLEVKVGDEVVLIGHSGMEYLSADQQASEAKTISYEIVTRLNADIPRIII